MDSVPRFIFPNFSVKQCENRKSTEIEKGQERSWKVIIPVRSSYRDPNPVTYVDFMLQVDHIILRFLRGTPDCGEAHRFGSANPVPEILANLGKPGSR